MPLFVDIILSAERFALAVKVPLNTAPFVFGKALNARTLAALALSNAAPAEFLATVSVADDDARRSVAAPALVEARLINAPRLGLFVSKKRILF